MKRQQLAAAERWLLADELSAQLRHAVGNKLGSARNAAFFIRRSLEKSAVPTDKRLPAFFQLIDDELSAAGQQLTSGLAGDRRSSGPSGGMRLRECIGSALTLRTPPTGVAVSVQCSEELIVSVGATELSVALGCLLDNSYESLESAGNIVIAASAEPDYTTISVSDSGGGFSPESAERALEAFYTTKPGHLGLGLNLVHRSVKEYGGRVVIDNVASGARVSLVLPQALLTPDPQPSMGRTI